MFIHDFYNIMLATDSYKISHANMLPDDLEYMETYAESRGGEYPYTLFFGLNYYIKSYLTGKQVTEEKIQEAKKLYTPHFGSDAVFPENKWRYILNEHNGVLPIKIEAVKEGSIIPVKNVLFKVSSTDKNCAWVVGIVETMLMRLWYPISVASNSMLGKEILDHHFEISGETSDTSFSLHDFGYRGVAADEQAWIGGASHLLSFKGTDTVAGIRMLDKYYNAGVQGFSVPASEHMVMSIRGRENEREAYVEAFKAYPAGILSLVSDTYDIYKTCKMFSEDEEIKQLILNRDGKFVIRPDSGDPVEVLEKCLNIIADTFGYTENSKGYKTVNEKIGLLWGDGVSVPKIHTYLAVLENKGWSVDNFVFGGGKEILQNFTRDTIKFAIKCSYAVLNGESIDVYKDPITGKGKKSKKGRQILIYNDEVGYKTVNHHELDKYLNLGYKEMLEPVFQNGQLLRDQSFEDIIKHVEKEKIIIEKTYVRKK